MTINAARKKALAPASRDSKLAKRLDDRDLIDSKTDKAERAGQRLARKIIASLEKDLGIISN